MRVWQDLAIPYLLLRTDITFFEEPKSAYSVTNQAPIRLNRAVASKIGKPQLQQLTVCYIGTPFGSKADRVGNPDRLDLD